LIITSTLYCKFSLHFIFKFIFIALQAAGFNLITSKATLGLDWSHKLTVSEENGGEQILEFGIRETGTDGIDETLNEVEQPPALPSGIFDARFLGANLGNGTFVDIRSCADSQHLLTIYFQRGNEGVITLSWEASELSRRTTAATLQDPFTDGALIQIDMRQVSRLEIDNTAINTINLHFIPSDQNETKTTTVQNQSWGRLRQELDKFNFVSDHLFLLSLWRQLQ